MAFIIHFVLQLLLLSSILCTSKPPIPAHLIPTKFKIPIVPEQFWQWQPGPFSVVLLANERFERCSANFAAKPFEEKINITFEMLEHCGLLAPGARSSHPILVEREQNIRAEAKSAQEFETLFRTKFDIVPVFDDNDGPADYHEKNADHDYTKHYRAMLQSNADCIPIEKLVDGHVTDPAEYVAIIDRHIFAIYQRHRYLRECKLTCYKRMMI